MAKKCCVLLQEQSTWTYKCEKIIFSLYLPVSGCVGLPKNGFWKHGAGGGAADRSQWFHSCWGKTYFFKILVIQRCICWIYFYLDLNLVFFIMKKIFKWCTTWCACTFVHHLKVVHDQHIVYLYNIHNVHCALVHHFESQICKKKKKTLVILNLSK